MGRDVLIELINLFEFNFCLRANYIPNPNFRYLQVGPCVYRYNVQLLRQLVSKSAST